MFKSLQKALNVILVKSPLPNLDKMDPVHHLVQSNIVLLAMKIKPVKLAKLVNLIILEIVLVIVMKEHLDNLLMKNVINAPKD